MPNPWFRLYSEFEDDPKVQRMSEPMQRRLLMLFCARCKEEQRTDEDFAFKWHVTLQDVTETKLLFIEKGFIDDDWNLLNWNRRQFVSDSSTERTRQWRQRTKQNGTSQNVTVTKRDGVDTDTDTEAYTETKTVKALASSDESLPAIGSLPCLKGIWCFTQKDVDDWQEAYPAIDVITELRKDREWLKANPRNKKTQQGMRRHVNAWLGRAQNSAKPNGKEHTNGHIEDWWTKLEREIEKDQDDDGETGTRPAS